MLQLKKSYQKVKGIFVALNVKKEKDSQKSILSYEYPSLLQELEPRLMFDGAAIETVDLADGISEQEQIYVLDAIDQNEQAHATESLLQAIEANSESFQTDYSQYREVVIIDAKVKDPHILMSNISRDAAIEVVLPEQNGMDRIAEILAKYQNLDAIHIISHGDQARLYLGDMILNDSNIFDYSIQLTSWGASLSENGDILFYGCDVAEGERGQAFVDQLKTLTSADIAASTDSTGSSVYSANWILENHTGEVNIESIFDGTVQAEYHFVLAPPELSLGYGWGNVGAGIDGENSGDFAGYGVDMSDDGMTIAV